MIKGVNHVGISVSNLDRSIAFYREGLGMEVVAQATFEPGKYGGKYEQILGLEGATGRVAMVRAAGLQLELFEFAYPAPRRGDPNRPVCDHGISHFCVEVAGDMEAHCERLKAAGAVFHCPPLDFDGKAVATYVRDPDGNVFELLQLPARDALP